MLQRSQGVTYPFDADDEAQKQAIVQLASEHCNPSAAGLPVPPLARWMRTCPSGQRLSAWRAARKPDLNSSAARCHHAAWITKQINQVELSIRQPLSLTFISSPNNLCIFYKMCIRKSSRVKEMHSQSFHEFKVKVIFSVSQTLPFTKWWECFLIKWGVSQVNHHFLVQTS